MARKTASQIVEKYQRRMGAAGQDYEAGVNNPSRDWEEATRAGADRWTNGVQQAISEGRFAKGVAGKGDKYRRKTATIGVQRFQQSAQSAAEEYAKVAERVVSIGQAASDRAKAAPNATPEQREQIALQNMRFIRDQWKK